MLQASPSPSPTPAAAFFAHFHRSTSFDTPPDAGPSTSASSTPCVSPGLTADVDVDVRRSRSLHAAGPHGGPGRGMRHNAAGLPSFASAGSDLASPPPLVREYTPPPASRHPLFSHHALPPGQHHLHFHVATQSPSPSVLSDPGASGSGPPSPSSPAGSLSSGAFSPASAFLSHFSSSTSLRPANGLPPDAQGARVLDYTLGRLLGRGGFSSVRQAIHVRTGEVRACKIVKRDDLSDTSGSLERFEDEIRIWQTMPRHPSLLPLLDMHRTPAATFLITPFLPGGSLLDVLRREGGSENTARKWFPGVVAAVAAMHEGFGDGFAGGMLHGDLKLDNFLVDHAGNVMVGDFGMAQRLDDGRPPVATIPPPMSAKPSTVPARVRGRPRMSSPLPAPASSKRPSPGPNDIASLPAQPFPSASLPYAPPELLRAPPAPAGLAQDMWALGVILHALLTGRLPFVDPFDPRLQMKILRGQWEEPPGLGNEWLEVLRGCLDTDRRRRWDIGRVKRSDALMGWREVKARSKSRSRSRAGRDTSRRHMTDEALNLGLRAGTTTPAAQPVPIRPRGRSGSADPVHRAAASYPTTAPADAFALDEELREPRSRSVSASRSRSSSRPASHGSATLQVPSLDDFRARGGSVQLGDDARGRDRQPRAGLRVDVSAAVAPMTSLSSARARSSRREPSPFAPVFPMRGFEADPNEDRAPPSPLSPGRTRSSSASGSGGRSVSRSRSARLADVDVLEVVDEERVGRRGQPSARDRSRAGRGAGTVDEQAAPVEGAWANRGPSRKGRSTSRGRR
ncbi:hypothetical protein Q5752_005189 [Cryptotrichosporon argae]